MMGVAATGAIAGDSLGYEIGRRFGPALQASRLGRKVGADRWQRAEAYLEAKGGRAIFAGRFVGVLRALVPAVAGATRMPYRRFLAWNALGAIIWAPGTVLAGYLAGSSYRRVERYAGPAGLVLLGAVVAVASVVFTARWITCHPDLPSGHATQTAAVAVTLAALGAASTGSWTRKVTIWSAAALVCLLVGFSRIYLGVHWPTDLLAGFALGALWAAICALAIRRPDQGCREQAAAAQQRRRRFRRVRS